MYQVSEIHSFSVSLAQHLKSAEEAIVVQFFLNTISLHKRRNRNFHEGRTWNYCSTPELAAIFPYWSEKQIKRILNSLIKKNILIKSKYNKKKFDKTSWFAFAEESAWDFSNKNYVGPNGPIDSPKRADRTDQMGRPIPMSKPLSNPFDIGDNVKDEVEVVDKSNEVLEETLPLFASKGKTLDIAKRFKLTDSQIEAFEYLKGKKIDSDDETLCYWAKSFSLERLIDVYEETKIQGDKVKSIGKYMRKLLKCNANVSKSHAIANKEFAEFYIQMHKIGNMKILKKYVKIYSGASIIELEFTMPKDDFQRSLIKYVA